MTNYRRNRVAGGSYFFTVNLADRASSLLVDHIGLLREAIRDTRERHPFTIDAMVVLPDHLHAACRAMKIVPKAACTKANAAFGSDVIGNTPFAMISIFHVTWITFTSIRSNTAVSRACKIGRIRRFIGM